MTYRRLAVTLLLLLATMPASVAVGIADAAVFGAEHGANVTRFMLGLMVGLVVGVRHFAAPRKSMSARSAETLAAQSEGRQRGPAVEQDAP